jgi:hypothetical protein
MEGSSFVAEQEGAGFIQVSASGVSAYIPVYVGHVEEVEASDGTLSSQNVYPEMNVEVPGGNKAKDSWRADLSAPPAEGSYDITALGTTLFQSEAAPENAQAVQDTILSKFVAYAARALFIGGSDYPLEIGAGVYKWNPNYIMHMQGNAAILQMSAASGSLLSTSPEQWRSFVNDARGSGAACVIVELDLNPTNFANAKELSMFQKALNQLQDEGKKVMVVSVQGLSTTSSVRDGIRFVNLGRLWRDDQTVNPEFSILRIRITGNNMQYDLQKAF